MKFDYIIGNPPYQDETLGDNKTFAPPIYHKFIDAACTVSDRVELIHPARFLFNAGNTPKEWNKKMLNNSHYKILMYEADVAKVFPNTSINGGIVISYFDANADYGIIGTFTPFSELNSVLCKVKTHDKYESLSPLVITRTIYRLTKKMHQDHPEAIGQLSDGHAYDMSSNIFERLPQIFFNEKPNDGYEYIRILGRESGNRVYKFIRQDYVNSVKNLWKYKVIVSGADGAAGTVGRPIPARIVGAPSIEGPGTGTTESFISIGAFENIDEAQNAMKYVKTKFARVMLGVKKATQAVTPEKWEYVPLQDFSSLSDIDWAKPIPEIDRQLYKKYGLDDAEIDFIETHVKEMN